MLSLVPGSLPRADDVAVDDRVVGFACAVAVLAGIVFGIASALHIARQSVAATLQSGGTRLTGNARQRLGRRLIVAAEVALSVVLLVGAGLLAGSFARLQRVTPGFDPNGVVTGNIVLPVGANFDPVRDGPGWQRFFDQFTARLDALPGVERCRRGLLAAALRRGGVGRVLRRGPRARRRRVKGLMRNTRS